MEFPVIKPDTSSEFIALRRRIISRRVKTTETVATLMADLALPRDQDRADRLPHAADFLTEASR